MRFRVIVRRFANAPAGSRSGKGLKRTCAGLFGLLVWMVALSGRAQEPLVPVTLALQWQHQAQFAGYYMALEKGYYAGEGLDVRFLRGGADVRVGALLASGEADFGSLMLSTALDERAQGIPLLHLAQLVNRSNFLLAAWRDPGDGGAIRTLADLDGRRISVWLEDFRAPYLALFASQDITPALVPQYLSFGLFLHRGVAACSAMRYNEYHGLLQSGVSKEEVLVFPLAEYGVDLPEDGVYCLASLWQERPSVCRAFVRASLAGWRYARDHHEETLDVVMAYVDMDRLPLNRMHMKWMLTEMIASIFPGEHDSWTVGHLSPDAYENTRNILSQHAGLTDSPDYHDFVVGEASSENP